MKTLSTHSTPCGSARAWKEQMARPRFAEMPYFSPMKNRLRILYVDDDPQVRMLGRLVLLRAGYDVDAAANGAAAWVALNEASYSLLVTDHDMPRMTGLELAAQARRSEMTIPIIVTSALLDLTENDETWKTLEIAAFLAKPYAVDSLLGAVARIVRGDDGAPPPVPVGGLVATGPNLTELPHVWPYRHGGIND